jgi:ice-binding like protein
MDTTRLCARQGVSGMKNSKAVVAMVAIALVIASGAMAGRTANAATPTVGLGTAASFSVLAGTPAITNTGATTIDKDVGIHPAASVTGFPPGTVGGAIHAGDAVALQAKSDLVVAYVDAASRPMTATHGALGGLTLVSGVYNAGGVVLDLTGTLTLDGQGDPNSVWVFQATSSLITASTSKVSLINGASPCNVFWQVTSSATLGSGSTFVGTILALTSITLANGVSVNGRALARNGDVTLINDTFTTTPCSGAPAAPPPASGGGSSERERPEATPAPTATPIPAPVFPPGQIVAPTAAPIAPPAPTVAPAAVPTSTPASAVAGVETRPLTGVQSLPSTSTDGPWSPLMGFGIALAGIGVLLLFGKPVRHP